MSSTTLTTTKVLAQKLGVGVETVRKWARDRRIPAYDLGRGYGFNDEEVLSALRTIPECKQGDEKEPSVT